MIYERSRRSTLLVCGSTLIAAIVCTAGSVLLYLRDAEQLAVLAIVIAAAALPFAVRAGIRLRAWPPGRLGLFRDRLVLIQGRLEQHMPWDRIETATLGAAAGWTSGRSSLIALTDRLTLRMKRWRGGQAVTFRPADFGLDPVSCRDLVLQLRDEAEARSRLPDFDSALDLSLRPIVSGELITPRL